jgi:signal transduction histidine kinase
VSLGIVHDHRGEICVKSNQGGGTTFEVLLPLTLKRELVMGGICMVLESIIDDVY